MEIERATMELEPHQDLISQLPDSILHDILARAFSDKDTLDLIRTCILLSKRWTNLWASFPHLHFSESCLPDMDGESNPAFPHLVNSVLLNRDASDVQSVFLSWWVPIDDPDDCRDVHVPHHLSTWLQYIVDHNARDVHVKADLNDRMFKLPRSLFACRSLEKLYLKITGYGEDGVGYVDLPQFVQLGRLRQLWLERFNIVPDALGALLSGCPVLEDMKLQDCRVWDPDICSDSLEKLDIGLCKIEGTLIRISGANLCYLSMICNEFHRLKVLLEDLPSLTMAYVQTDDYCIRAEPLEFISSRREGMSKRKLAELETFRGLKNVVLDAQLVIENLPAVAHFLERSPNLELLELGMRVLISRDPKSKKLHMKNMFHCPHLQDILATGEGNYTLPELLSEFCDNKCSCFPE